MDASSKGWGESSQGQRSRVPCLKEERTPHINVPELKGAKLPLTTFTISQKKKNFSSCKNGQHSGIVLSNEDGRGKKSENAVNQQGDLRLQRSK